MTRSEKNAIISCRESSRRKNKSKTAIVELIVGIILICLFLISWLVFKNIKASDWIALVLGVLDLIIFALTIKKEKK